MTTPIARRGRLIPIAPIALIALIAFGAPVAARPAHAVVPPARVTTPAATAPVVAAAVTIQNLAFVPNAVSIAAGQPVVWTNADSTAHTVTSDTGAFTSPTLQPGGRFTFTFSTPGTYPYHCSIHPFMTGTITVS